MTAIDLETGEKLRTEESAVITTELELREVVIERGLTTFIEVGQALMEIRDRRLYCQQHKTFEQYCIERWGMKRWNANYLIAASAVMDNLVDMSTSAPANARQAYPLSSLAPDVQRTVWQAALDTAPGGKVTAVHVQDTVDDYMGKKKPKTNRAANEYVPQGFDACQTPPYALDPLLPYLNTEWTIWEPASGEGLLVEALFDSGFNRVEASDLLTGQNFFEYAAPEWDCLVTNPPYTLKYKWLDRCYQLGNPFALLLPVETLGAKTAQEMFRVHGIQVLFLDKRINFKMPNIGFEGSSAQFPVAWFCWQLDLGSDMVFGNVVPN